MNLHFTFLYLSMIQVGHEDTSHVKWSLCVHEKQASLRCFLFFISTWIPDVGPLIKTTDSNVFKKVIDTLSAAGGGDDEEMSLSGLEVLWRVAFTPSKSDPKTAFWLHWSLLIHTLSLIQLALTNAPLNSEVFLFTDAPAKDKNLKNTVIAIIERTQSVVSI